MNYEGGGGNSMTRSDTKTQTSSKKKFDNDELLDYVLRAVKYYN